MNKIIFFLKIHQKAFTYILILFLFIYAFHDSLATFINNIILSNKLADGVVNGIVKILDNIVEMLLGCIAGSVMLGNSMIKYHKKNNTQDNK